MPALEELGERAAILRRRGGAAQHAPARLEVLELDFAAERKLQLVARQHVKHRHLVAHAHGAPQLGLDGLLVVVQIGHEDQQAAAFEHVDRSLQRLRRGRRARCLHLRERREHRAQVRLAGAARDELPDCLVVDREPDAIALSGDQIGERRGGHARVVDLRDARLARETPSTGWRRP